VISNLDILLYKPIWFFEFVDAWLLKKIKKSKFFMLLCNYLLSIRGQRSKERFVLDFSDGSGDVAALFS
jgi:hypothetical protein